MGRGVAIVLTGDNKQVGTIQRQIGQVDEAVLSFQDAIALDPESRLALEGAGEAYLAQAHARTTEGLYTAATTALRSGCEATRRFLALLAAPATPAAAATAAAGGGGECAWKLLGDLYTYAHKLPPMCFEADGSRERGAGEGGRCKAGTAEAAVEQAVSRRALSFFLSRVYDISPCTRHVSIALHPKEGNFIVVVSCMTSH